MLENECCYNCFYHKLSFVFKNLFFKNNTVNSKTELNPTTFEMNSHNKVVVNHIVFPEIVRGSCL